MSKYPLHVKQKMITRSIGYYLIELKLIDAREIKQNKIYFPSKEIENILINLVRVRWYR